MSVEEAWRRLAWLRAGWPNHRLARSEGWPPEGVTRRQLEREARLRDVQPWIPPDTPGVGVLLCRGAPPGAPGVAVVGARASDPYGLQCARQVSEDCVELGVSVVSGGAEGCDRAAHEAAMTRGGHTVVVIAGGHDHPSPAAHAQLFDRVVTSGGCLVSACWPTTRPTPGRFLARNRVIAALAAVTVVARARTRSGSLSTARAAMKLGRPVFAVPGDVGQDLSAGCHDLLVQGARPLLGPGQLRWALAIPGESSARWPVRGDGSGVPWPARRRRPVPTSPPPRTPAQSRVADVLREHLELDPPRLVGQTGLSIAQVMSALMCLCLDGSVEELPGSRFRWVAGDGAERAR